MHLLRLSLCVLVASCVSEFGQPANFDPGTPQVGPDGQPLPPGEALPGINPELRFVVQNETLRSVNGQTTTVVPSRYPGLTRSVNLNPWDVKDPRTGLYLAAYQRADGTHGIYAAAPEGAREVSFQSVPAELFERPLIWGVMSPDGSLLYLSGRAGSFVAQRVGNALSFGPLVSVGQNIEIVHDVSPNGRLAIASGHLPYKWGNQADVVAPRQMSLFNVGPDGSLSAAPGSHPPLGAYIQSPTFTGDSAGLVYEGDDDVDTGDRLFLYRFGSAPQEITPTAVQDNDFNTPCVTTDGRIAFWESLPGQYHLRVHDIARNTTSSVDDRWLPFTGYVRCR